MDGHEKTGIAEARFDSKGAEVVVEELKLEQHCAHRQVFSEGVAEAEWLLNLDCVVVVEQARGLEAEGAVQTICVPQ